MGHARTFFLAVFALVPLLAQEKPKDAATVRQPKFTLVAGAGSSASIAAVPGGLIAIGMSDGVRAIADKVHELDVPKAGGDPGK